MWWLQLNTTEIYYALTIQDTINEIILKVSTPMNFYDLNPSVTKKGFLLRLHNIAETIVFDNLP